jgi:hypothetical protein
MEIEVKAWLYDVLNAIIEIEGFFATNNINFPEYQDNVSKSGRKKPGNYR